MMLQAVASFTTALTIVTASLPSGLPRGEAPTFSNDPDANVERVVANFRETNQLLMVVEDQFQSLESQRAIRVKPVLALLEEQLGEAADQLTTASHIEAASSHVSPDVYDGINADIGSVSHDLKQLASAMVTSNYL